MSSHALHVCIHTELWCVGSRHPWEGGREREREGVGERGGGERERERDGGSPD